MRFTSLEGDLLGRLECGGDVLVGGGRAVGGGDMETDDVDNDEDVLALDLIIFDGKISKSSYELVLLLFNLT
jgi:hypothetical protein